MTATRNLIAGAVMYFAQHTDAKRITGSLVGEDRGDRCIVGVGLSPEYINAFEGRGVIPWHYPAMMRGPMKVSENDAMILTKLNDCVSPPSPYVHDEDALLAALTTLFDEERSVTIMLDRDVTLWLYGVPYRDSVKVTPHPGATDYLSITKGD